VFQIKGFSMSKEDKILSSEFLEQLKKIREQKEISIEEIAEKTNIKTQYIKAIEEGDLSQLPGGVYNKAYIRSVSEFLGINIKAFEKQIDNFNYADQNQVKVEFGKSTSSLKPTKLIILFCLVLIGILYFSYFNNKKSEKILKLAETKSSPISNEVKKVDKKEFTTSIIALNNVKIKLKNMFGEVKLEKSLKKSETLILDSEDKIYADIDNIKNIEVYLNGVLVKNFQQIQKTEAGYDFSVNSLFSLTQDNSQNAK
jgi:cytoskeletal protein RodZ